MRPISEATQAILKSQNLSGQNRFGYQLKIEGTEYFSDIKNVKNNVLGGSFADFCIRADGKVLFAYLSGTELYIKTINSEKEMMTTSNHDTGGSLFYSFERIIEPQCFSLLRLKNGKILLFLNSVRLNSGLCEALCYVSNSGLGDDFTLLSSLNSFNAVGVSSILSYSNTSTCKGSVLADGSIVVVTAKHYNYSGYLASAFNAYKSIDGGATWVLKGGQPEPGTAGTRYGQISNLMMADKFLMCLMTYGYGSVQQRALISSDGGETWSWDTSNFPGLPNSASYEMDGLYFAFDGSNLFMVKTYGLNKAALYKAKSIQGGISYASLCQWSNWELVADEISANGYAHYGSFTISPTGALHFLRVIPGGSFSDFSAERDSYSAQVNASSISISKSNGGANMATIQASNQNGILNPKNPDSPLYGILSTNKQVIIKQGYADELVETFTGMIDGFDMSTWPQETSISLRDNLKKALDQTVTYMNGHTVEFGLQPIENIVQFLCYLAGIEVGEVEATGIQVEKTFSWESYADCFQFLGDLASFEWGCDEYGKFYFRRDYQPDDMYVAYTFEEGVDIESLSYTIKDDDLYYKVVVFGEDSNGNIISYEAPFLDAAAYNILPQKILKIDATEAKTIGELRKIAERAIALMQSRTALVSFSSIGIPWLQSGDFIGVYERSTGASSVYKISGINSQMDADGYTMDIDASYYGDSIVPGELPNDTAIQTAAPTVNIIPEMTSNKAPSGVARASSVYSSSFEPWQAFNSASDDLYWNAITNTGWIEYQFPQKTIVDKYMIKARQLSSYNDAMPKNWTFEGFDGAKWIVLDTRTNQTTWGPYETRSYLFTNAAAYSKYRLNVSRNNGYNRLQIEQLAMYYRGGA